MTNLDSINSSQIANAKIQKKEEQKEKVNTQGVPAGIADDPGSFSVYKSQESSSYTIHGANKPVDEVKNKTQQNTAEANMRASNIDSVAESSSKVSGADNAE